MRRFLSVVSVGSVIYAAAFFAYVSFANDPGCGSLEPGACFGAGVLMMLILPIGILVLIIRLFWFAIDRFKARSKSSEIPQ